MSKVADTPLKDLASVDQDKPTQKEYDPVAIAKLNHAIARQHLAEIRVAQEELKLIRRNRITTWNEYISFGVCKSVGLAGLIVGGLEFLDPNFLSITLGSPGLIAGAGFALLTGKNIAALLAKLERDDHEKRKPNG